MELEESKMKRKDWEKLYMYRQSNNGCNCLSCIYRDNWDGISKCKQLSKMTMAGTVNPSYICNWYERKPEDKNK